MATITNNLGLKKPSVGGDRDQWGTDLNINTDKIDALFSSGGTGTPVNLHIGSGKTLKVDGVLDASSATSVSLASVQGDVTIGGALACTNVATQGLESGGPVQISGELSLGDEIIFSGINFTVSNSQGLTFRGSSGSKQPIFQIKDADTLLNLPSITFNAGTHFQKYSGRVGMIYEDMPELYIQDGTSQDRNTCTYGLTHPSTTGYRLFRLTRFEDGWGLIPKHLGAVNVASRNGEGCRYIIQGGPDRDLSDMLYLDSDVVAQITHSAEVLGMRIGKTTTGANATGKQEVVLNAGSNPVDISNVSYFNQNINNGGALVVHGAPYVTDTGEFRCGGRVVNTVNPTGANPLEIQGEPNGDLLPRQVRITPKGSIKLGSVAYQSLDDPSIYSETYFVYPLSPPQGDDEFHDAIRFVANIKNEPKKTVGYIRVQAFGTLYRTVSDYRLKDNISFLPDCKGLNIVNRLKPRYYNFTGGHPQNPHIGLIAHEVQEVMDHIADGKKDAVDHDGEPIYQGIDYSKLVPVLIASIQDLSRKVEALEKKVCSCKS